MYKCLPPGGRGTALAVEGACVNDKQSLFYFTRSPSVALARTPKTHFIRFGEPRGASSLPEGA